MYPNQYRFRLDHQGKASLPVVNPGPYRDDDGRVYPSHVHYVPIPEDGSLPSDPSQVRTLTVLREIDLPFLQRLIKQPGLVPVDALGRNKINDRTVFLTDSSTEEQIRQTLSGGPYTPVVVYCAHETCNAGPRLCERLGKMGFYNVWHYSGGWREWSRAALGRR